MTDQPEFEELEHIPWAALAAKSPDPRVRIATLAIAGLSIVAVCLFAVSQFLGGDDPAAPNMTTTPTAPVYPAASVTEETVAAPAPPGAVSETGAANVPTLPASAPTTAAVYSEADLMLINVEDEARLAAVQAEWFVRDYLTFDGDDSVSDRVAALLPADTPPPIEQVSSYVEWVDSFAVVSPSPGEYRVEVVYRLLTGTTDGFAREPVGALVVSISVDVDGSAHLLAVPEPTEVPILLGLENDGGR